METLQYKIYRTLLRFISINSIINSHIINNIQDENLRNILAATNDIIKNDSASIIEEINSILENTTGPPKPEAPPPRTIKDGLI